MDTQTQNNIPEYVKNLPQKVQDFVFDSEWEKRTMEIAKKYSLSTGQSDALANIVVLVLIGIEKPQTFLQTIVTDLGISKLLAEQVVSDLETRVFDYAIKQIQTSRPVVAQPPQSSQAPVIPQQKTPTPQPIQPPKPVQQPQVNPVQNKVPEVRPVNVPMVEKQPPTQTPAPKYVPPIQKELPKEPAQQPVPVPRFTSVPPTPTPNTPPVTTTPANPVQDSIQNKLDAVVKTPPQPAPKAPERYTVDPYREPLN